MNNAMVLDTELAADRTYVLHQDSSNRNWRAHTTGPRSPGGLTTEKTGQTRLLALLFIVLVSAFVTACARKAPGPEECHAFAERWVQVEGVRLPRSRLFLPEDVVGEAVYLKTLECLSTPYERAFVECVVNTSTPRLCQGPGLDRFQSD